MRDDLRKAFRFALDREADPAARQWLRLMLRGEDPPKKKRRRRREARERKGE